MKAHVFVVGEDQVWMDVWAVGTCCKIDLEAIRTSSPRPRKVYGYF